MVAPVGDRFYERWRSQTAGLAKPIVLGFGVGQGRETRNA
jgi:hypothetical protein